jgi:uncharacterized membrane protein YbhN (UPF0104 family)
VLAATTKVALFAVVLFFVARALLQRLAGVDWASLRIDWSLLLAAMGVQAAGMLVWAWTFHMLLSRLALAPRATTTFSIACVARLGKYVPGKVASVLGTVWLMRSRGVPLGAAIGAPLLQQGLWVVIGLLAAVPLTLWDPIKNILPMAWLWCGGLAILGVICLHPRLFLPLVNKVLRRFKVAPLTVKHGLGVYGAPAVTTLAGAILAGVTLWLIAGSVAPLGVKCLPLCISAAGLSAVSGYLVMFAPAGLGVREGVMLILMTPMIGPAPAAVAVIISRLMQTVVEVIFAGAGLIVLRGRPAIAQTRPNE